MGSFQQIILGSTCLAAAFFFGSYLHNRPANNHTTAQGVTAPVDPMESLLGFGQRTVSQTEIIQPAKIISQIQTPVLPTPAIDPSELAPVLVSNQQPDGFAVPTLDNAAARKPVVPDFSELAARFRNTPLELGETAAVESVFGAVHESERVDPNRFNSEPPQFSATFRAPEMVIRQPEVQQPLQDFQRAVDQVEQARPREFVGQPPSNRWRVGRPNRIDRFNDRSEPSGFSEPSRFDPPSRFREPSRFSEPSRFTRPSELVDTEPRQTIDDVVSDHSADWLGESSNEQTFATNPPQTRSWDSQQHQQVTERAALRNRDLLDIEDPGNRFSSVRNEVQEFERPEPDFGNEYYTRSDRRQDTGPSQAARRATPHMRPIRGGNETPNWGRQSNVSQQFDGRYQIQAGDTLQSISTRFYGSPDRYLDIYRANRSVLDRITSSPVGVMIEIPNSNN